MPEPDDFALVASESRPLGQGEIRVRNRWLSVDPYMRARMNDAKGYSAPYALDEALTGGAIGEVIESRAEDYPIGDLVQHMAGWREEAMIDTAASGFGAGATRIPPETTAPQAYLHMMGLTGGTAYFGLLECAAAKPGDIVFVSAAAGAVGSAVVQIAKLKGMTVIGSAGGAEKCAWVRELGADACIDYKAGPVLDQLRAAAPDGIDVYFDNVGSDHLDAALACARLRARFAICGMIDIYNDMKPPSLRYLSNVIGRHIRIEGFLYPDYIAGLAQFRAEMGEWLGSGRIASRETITDGIESMVDAFRGLFTGENTGKMLVRL